MIKVDRLYLSYTKTSDKILEDVSLEIDAKITFLLGKNGSGKSSFLKFLSQTENLFSCGNFTINNENIIKLNQKEISGKISLLLQENNSSDIFVDDIYKISNLFSINPLDKKTVEEIKDIFNVKTLGNKNFNQLSGGEKQKVLIISFFIYNSEILLFDEPFTAIDFCSIPSFIEILKTYFPNKQKVISIHDLNYIFCKNSPIIFIENKKIIKFKNLQEFVKSPTFSKNYPSIKFQEKDEKIHFYF